MKNLTAFICLFFAVSAFAPLRAEDTNTTQANPSPGNTQSSVISPDPYAGIAMYARADDFATIQQLAVQNRVDRIVLMQQSLACFQQATMVDDIYRCRIEESRGLNKIRLTYCKTGISTPQRLAGKNTVHADDQAKEDVSCQKAIAALAGKRVKKSKKPPTTLDGAQAPVAGDASLDPNARAALAGKRLKKGKNRPTTLEGPQAPATGDMGLDPAAVPTQ